MFERSVQDVDVDELPRLAELVSPAGVKDELERMEPTLLQLGRQASETTVQSEEDRRRATDLLGALKRRLDDLEAGRRERSGPFDAAAKAINRVYRLVTGPLRAEYDGLRDRVGAYVILRQQREEAALAAQREAEQQAARAGAKAAERLGVPAPVVRPREAPPQVETHVDTGAASSTVRRRWRAVLVDARAAFEAYPSLFEFDEQRAVRLRQAGVQEVPGVRFEQVPDVAVRT